MAGLPFMADPSFAAASPGYAVPGAYAGSGGVTHGRFVVWLIVYALVAIAIIGGLKVGGFSFVFRTR